MAFGQGIGADQQRLPHGGVGGNVVFFHGGADALRRGGGGANGHVAALQRNGDIGLRLGEIAQEGGGGTLAGLIALDHDHSRTLLHGTALLHTREGGNLQYANLNIGHSAVGVRHLRGGKAGGGGRAHKGDQFAGLHIVGAVASRRVVIALGIGYDEVIPHAAEDLAVQVEIRLAMVGLEHGLAQLGAAHQQVVGVSVAAEEVTAVAPRIILGGNVRNALPRGEVVRGHAAGRGEGLPRRPIQVQRFRAFLNGEDIQAGSLTELTFLQVGGVQLLQFILGEVRGQVGQLAVADVIPRAVGIGGERVG